jgi:hypothetical protein
MGRTLRACGLVLGLSLVGGAGCAIDEGTDAELETANAGGGPSGGEPVSRWNQNGFTALTIPNDVRFQVRGLTMMHIAMHDAANAASEHYETYVLDDDPYENLAADPSLAAAKAARDVIVALRPSQQSQADQWLAVDLAKVTNPTKRANSLTIGAAAAQAIVQLRANDNCCSDFQYVPGNQPGDYQFTPPFDQFFFAYGTGWPGMAPFAMSSGSQFRTAGPPALTSAQWTADYNEVKSLGSNNSTTRTQQQTFLAFFWVDGSAEIYARMARNLIAEQQRNLWDSARALALGFIAGSDSALASFDAKYHFEFWRPITAIRAGDSDGNPDTVGDAAWTPAATNPPTPDYTSTHAATCAAVAVALAEVFGDVPVHATSSIVPGEVSWSSLTASALECAEARIWVGYHYRTSIEDGLDQGFGIGGLVADLLPVDD